LYLTIMKETVRRRRFRETDKLTVNRDYWHIHGNPVLDIVLDICKERT